MRRGCPRSRAATAGCLVKRNESMLRAASPARMPRIQPIPRATLPARFANAPILRIRPGSKLARAITSRATAASKNSRLPAPNRPTPSVPTMCTAMQGNGSQTAFTMTTRIILQQMDQFGRVALIPSGCGAAVPGSMLRWTSAPQIAPGTSLATASALPVSILPEHLYIPDLYLFTS